MTRQLTFDQFCIMAGEHLGYSAWMEIPQSRIDAFAEATDDRQWIHLDPVKAATGPYGVPIAHGFLTLSMLPAITRDIWQITDLWMGINYGLDRVRFPSVVPAGSWIRGGAQLHSITAVTSGVQAAVTVTVERRDHDKAVCVAELLMRLVPNQNSAPSESA